MRIWILTFLIAAAAATAFGAVPEPALQQLQENMNQAVASARPSVVSVKAQKKKTGNDGQAVWYESIGSGFFVDERGFILTNYHVVEGSENITVTLWRSQQNQFSARVVHTDKSLDLAALKIDSTETFVPAVLDNSDRLETGDWVVSIGSPFGFEHSVTMGIVSDLHRNMMIEGISYKDMIQTDAVINQGNSGGPLINIYGRVVGVGTAIYAPKGTYTGLGFAIPINRAKHFFTRVTGAVQAALTVPAAQPNAKEPINLNKKMPNDAIHQDFSDCTKCHTITQKMVVSTKAVMTHPPAGVCTTCHIMTNDKVAKGPVTVAAVNPISEPPAVDQGFSDPFIKIIIKMSLMVLVASIVFTMLGVGGGFLYVPILLACGIDFQTAAITSLFMLTTGQISALYNFFKSGLVDLKLAFMLEFPTMIGAFIGGMFAHHFNLSLLSVMFACVLFLASYFMLQDEAKLKRGRSNFTISSWEWSNEFLGHKYSIDMMLAVPLTFVVGYVGGTLGLGGGWLKVPMMVMLFGIPMKVAVATSSLMVPITGFAGFVGHSISGYFDARLALPLSLVTIVGAQIGSRISIKAESNLLRFIFAFVLSLVGLWMLIRLL
ncbi:MAG TPA: TSUP family transporter [Anaerolineae bacterium]|nr:TSUP family transporter [Anaerolineae bacterium]